MAVLIVEGVTGSVRARRYGLFKRARSFRLYDEQATFDDFLTQFWDDPRAAARRALGGFDAILTKIERHPGQHITYWSRFHFSPIAVGSDPAQYRAINERCAALHCHTAVLIVPEEQLRCRSLYRKEHGARDWQSLIAPLRLRAGCAQSPSHCRKIIE